MTRSAVLLAAIAFVLAAARAPAQAVSTANHDWAFLQKTAVGSKVHVSTDSGGHVCHVQAIKDDSILCVGGFSSTVRVYSRASVKSVKRTRYGWSTLAGFAIGTVAGGVVGRITNPPQPSAFIDLSGLAQGAIAVMGGVAGAGLGGGFDMLRGPVLYVRP